MSKRKKYEHKCWFSYNGVGDPFHASSYREICFKPEGSKGSTLSAIYATGCFTPVSPLSANIQRYIATALVSGLSQPPTINKHSRCFVFLKG